MDKKLTVNLHQIGSISWPKLFRAWEKREAKQSGWIRHYCERGYTSWREWRTAAFKDLYPKRRKWTMYKVTNPEIAIPKWFGGPFRGWQKHYHSQAVTFKTLATRRAIQKHGYVLRLVKYFPRTTQLLGVIWRGKIVVIEGMHRACAVALAARQGRKIKTSVTIALTPLVGEMPNLSSRSKP